MKIPYKRRAARRSRTLAKPTAMAQIKRTKRRGLQMGSPVLLKRKKANTFALSLMEKMRKLKTLTAVADSWKDGEPPEEVTLDSKGSSIVRAGVAPAIENGLFSGKSLKLFDRNVYPFMVRHTTRNSTASGRVGLGAEGQHYFTTFETGIPSTRSMNRLAKDNGTASVKFANSQYDSGLGLSTATKRGSFTLSTGFNQKLIASNKAAHVQNKEIYDLFQLNSLAFSRDKKQRIYGMVKSFYQKMRFMNTNAYKALNLKISLFAANMAPPPSPDSTISHIFPNLDQLNSQISKMPNRYVFSVFQTVGDVGFGYCDPVAGPMLSPFFADRWTPVKSFSKTLDPGDIWDFKYIHHCGGGIRLDRLKEWSEASNSGPMGYLIIFELTGSLCEAIIQGQVAPLAGSNGDSIIGLSPAFIQYEYEKGHTTVMDTTPVYSTTEPVGGVLTGAGEFAIRTFTERELASTPQKINFPIGRVGVKGETDTDIYIPVMTDVNVKYAQKAENL